MNKTLIKLFVAAILILVCKQTNASCVDTDGGKNYFNKGKVEDTFFIDKCFDQRSSLTENNGGCYGEHCYVREIFCDNNQPLEEKHKCEYGCIDGACLQSPSTSSINECSTFDFNKNGYCAYIITPGKNNTLMPGQKYQIKWAQKGTADITQVSYSNLTANYSEWINFTYKPDNTKEFQTIDWTVPEKLAGAQVVITIQIYNEGYLSDTFNVAYKNPQDAPTSAFKISNTRDWYDLKNQMMYVAWETDRESESWINFTIMNSNSPTGIETGSVNLTKSHTVKFSIAPEAKVYYKIISIDRDKNRVESSRINFSASDIANLTYKDPGAGSNSIISSSIRIKNTTVYNAVKGKILIKVEANGEAYYVHPTSKIMYYLGRPNDAFSVMRERGGGITNSNLSKIPIGLANLTGLDSDNDGLTNMFEDAIGTNKNNPDSDGDGFNDKVELTSNNNPNGVGKLTLDKIFSNLQKGKIFLQTEKNGEAWYINPSDGKRYFLGRPDDAFQVMRSLGLGISNNNFNNL